VELGNILQTNKVILAPDKKIKRTKQCNFYTEKGNGYGAMDFTDWDFVERTSNWAAPLALLMLRGGLPKTFRGLFK